MVPWPWVDATCYREEKNDIHSSASFRPPDQKYTGGMNDAWFTCCRTYLLAS